MKDRILRHWEREYETRGTSALRAQEKEMAEKNKYLGLTGAEKTVKKNERLVWKKR